ncbi:hypothetical protein [Herminiimonas aquatilis]|uniref:Uncharacterized protein n=1 Tax=Herminiimonas aquatilis TaxID=345342 RepID=A0ABW2J967_9BURK
MQSTTRENWTHSHVFNEGNPLAERNTLAVVAIGDSAMDSAAAIRESKEITKYL